MQGTMTIGKPQKGFIDEGKRTEEKKVLQLRKGEFVIYPICMTMNKAKLEPRFNVQKQKNYFTREVLSTNKWMIAN